MNALSPPKTLDSTPRDHSLDALRAVAMLGGILLHAVWMYSPADVQSPIIDQSANDGPFFLLYLIHAFRMHAFFLIAGFFGAMLYKRHGARQFLNHRLKRIGLPLIIGWLVLYPIVRWCYLWGAEVSGANLSGVSMKHAFWAFMSSWEFFITSFSFAHLWFLFVLMIYCLATVALVEIVWVKMLLPRWRQFIQQAFSFIMKPGWNIAILSFVTAFLLYRLSWFGVDTPKTLQPPIQSLLVYGLFFLVGWGIHANRQLLNQFQRSWKSHFAVGIALSIPLFVFLKHQSAQGKLTYHRVYPLLQANEILDWEGIRQDLLNASTANNASAQAKVWRRLPDHVQRFVSDHGNLNLKQESAVANQFNRYVLLNPNTFHDNATPVQNRETLEKTFPGRLASSYLDSPIYRLLKAINSLAYGIVSWTLVFGCVGFFRQYFYNPNAVFRYLSDASYWMYLIHLPVLFFIEIPMSQWHAHWALKLSILNLSCFGILLASYQLFVRNTIIGVCLNGRRIKSLKSQQISIQPEGVAPTAVTS